MEIPVEYYVSYGREGGSARCSYWVEVNDKQYRAYLKASIKGINYEAVPELDKVYDKAYREIHKYERYEYDTDVDEEGSLRVEIMGGELTEYDFEEAMFAAIKEGDAKYLENLFEQKDDYEGDIWQLLIESIQKYKKTRIRKTK